jgi:hypothetical protein
MKKFLILVCTSVVIASCAGAPDIQQSSGQTEKAAGTAAGAPDIQRSSGQTEKAADTAAGAPDPALRPLEEIYAGGRWVTRPSGGAITVIGITGRRRNKDEALADALADAARRVALYHGVYGESASVLNQGSGNLDYYADFDYRLTLHNEPGSFIDALAFDKDSDVLEKDGTVYVRTKYSGVCDVPAYSSSMEDGKPEWVKNYAASIPGFLAGVGASKNKGSPQKTYQASYENAIVSILPSLSTQISGESIDVTGAKLATNVSVSRGSLINTMILETWFDRKTGAVWTLVAARQKPE